MKCETRKFDSVAIGCAIVAIMLVAVFLFTASPATAGDTSEVTQNGSGTETPPDSTYEGDTIIAYYFHGTQRCATCRKLEAYTEEALYAGFGENITDSILLWRPMNYDEKENAHFIEDYQLFTKAVILSRQRAGKEVKWKNLDRIWQLVQDKEAFLSYIQIETRLFLRGDTVDE